MIGLSLVFTNVQFYLSRQINLFYFHCYAECTLFSAIGSYLSFLKTGPRELPITKGISAYAKQAPTQVDQ